MTTPSPPTKPGLRTLSRRLDHLPDPLALFVRLRASADPCPRALFETADQTEKREAQSLLYVDPAIRCRLVGDTVDWHPLTANGRFALDSLRRAGWTDGARELPDGGFRFPVEPAPRTLDEAARLRAAGPFDPLRALLWSWQADSKTLESVHAYGLFAYDLADRFESLPPRQAAERPVADFEFHLCETRVLINHAQGSTTITTVVFGDDPPQDLELTARRRLTELERLIRSTPDPVLQNRPRPARPGAHSDRTTLSDEAFATIVRDFKDEIARGEVFQIVPSRRFETACPDPLRAYAELRQLNPSPYMFFLEDGDGILFGASPESALKVSAAESRVEIRPIAGTRPRALHPDGSLDADRDARLELELRLSAKELAEHAMLIDLARNDVARVSQPGTRTVTELMAVERYSHVMHLVSRVQGTLDPDLDALHAYQACLNMGTLTGAPKIRAMQLLRNREPHPRGPYGGAVGYLDLRGNLDTAIVIRSAWVAHGQAWVQAGCGVVADSDPVQESDETRRKAEAVLEAIERTRGDSGP
jgi:anthranilate synthase component 1